MDFIPSHVLLNIYMQLTGKNCLNPMDLTPGEDRCGLSFPTCNLGAAIAWLGKPAPN